MRLSWPHLAALAGATLLLGACATTDLYQTRDGRGGYAETQLGAAHWRVEFVGTDTMSRDTVDAYLLYRAVELTAENGHEWFAMAAPAVSEEVDIIVEAQRPRDWRHRSRFFWSDLDPVGPMPSERPRMDQASVSQVVHCSASAEIFMGYSAPAAGAFNAQDIIARLGPSIVRPPA